MNTPDHALSRFGKLLYILLSLFVPGCTLLRFSRCHDWTRFATRYHEWSFLAVVCHNSLLFMFLYTWSLLRLVTFGPALSLFVDILSARSYLPARFTLSRTDTLGVVLSRVINCQSWPSFLSTHSCWFFFTHCHSYGWSLFGCFLYSLLSLFEPGRTWLWFSCCLVLSRFAAR